MDLRNLLDRFQHGEREAVEELLRRAAGRLERLARAMLRNFPTVRQREQTADVLNEALLSLVGALRQLSFTSTRDFYGLAAEHIRRRLLDLGRYHGRAHRGLLPLEQAGDEADRARNRSEDEELDRWQALHEAAAELPAEQREVFALRFYHGWGVEEVAGLLQVSTKTVTRLWLRAQMALTEKLGGKPLPGAGDAPAG